MTGRGKWAFSVGIVLYLGIWLIFGIHLMQAAWIPAGEGTPGSAQPTETPAPTATATPTLEETSAPTPTARTLPIASFGTRDAPPPADAADGNPGDTKEEEEEEPNPDEVRIILVPGAWGFDGIALSFEPDTLFRELLIATGAGILGAAGWAAVSYAMQGARLDEPSKHPYIAPRDCTYYLVRPLAGPALAILLFAVLRAGVNGISAEGVDTASPISIVLIGALGGLFLVGSVSVLERAMESLFQLDKDKSGDGKTDKTATDKTATDPPPPTG